MVEPYEQSPEESALARMAPVISHEIRNPLAVLGNSAYFIKTKLAGQSGLDPKVAKHLGIIESEIRRANETLGEILAFARMREPACSPQRFNALVEATLKTLDLPAPLLLKKDLCAQDPSVSADPELLGQALRHVLRNGVESLVNEAGESPSLAVRTSIEAGSARLEVSDNGPGMTEDALANLFVPFHTGKPRGIGLGLAFARKVLVKHRGKIEVRNTPPKGCTFTLSLPLA